MNASYLTSMCATLLAMAMFAGCTGDTETTPSPESTPANSQPVTPEASEPEEATETEKAKDNNEETSNSIPDDFPDDIYVADGSKTSEFKESGGKNNLILEYPASDIDEFVAGYQKGMTEQGWTQVTSSKLPIGTITNYSKDDRKCTISISPPKDEVIKVAIVLPK